MTDKRIIDLSDAVETETEKEEETETVTDAVPDDGAATGSGDEQEPDEPDHGESQLVKDEDNDGSEEPGAEDGEDKDEEAAEDARQDAETTEEADQSILAERVQNGLTPPIDADTGFLHVFNTDTDPVDLLPDPDHWKLLKTRTGPDPPAADDHITADYRNPFGSKYTVDITRWPSRLMISADIRVQDGEPHRYKAWITTHQYVIGARGIGATRDDAVHLLKSIPDVEDDLIDELINTQE